MSSLYFLYSGNSAAAASAAHIVRDLVKVAKNLAGE